MFLTNTVHTQPFLDVVLALAGIGILIGSLEDLLGWNAFSDSGLMSWQVSRTQCCAALRGGQGRILEALLSLRGFQWVIATRLATICLLLTFQFHGAAQAVLLLILLACNLAYNVRCPYGLSGDHQMTTIVLLSLFLASLQPENRIAQRVCLWFIGLQGVLSYAVAGWSKLSSPAWRSGHAISGVMRTNTYGNPAFSQAVQKWPLLALLTAWGTMLFESAFPLVFSGWMPLRSVFFSAGILFHFQVACLMGLNLFFWAFLSTYPAILFCTLSFRF